MAYTFNFQDPIQQFLDEQKRFAGRNMILVVETGLHQLMQMEDGDLARVIEEYGRLRQKRKHEQRMEEKQSASVGESGLDGRQSDADAG